MHESFVQYALQLAWLPFQKRFPEDKPNAYAHKVPLSAHILSYMLAKSAAIKHGKSGYFISTRSNFKLAAFCIYLLSLDAKKLTSSQNNYYFWWPTLWTLNYFLRDMHAIPIRLNKCITLLGDPPDIRIPKLRRKFPTGIFDPGIFGWLHHTFSLLLHLLFPQMVLTSTKYPICLVSTSGLSDLEEGQQWNSNNNLVRKTMYLGSVWRFWYLLDVLFGKKTFLLRFSVCRISWVFFNTGIVHINKIW